MKLKKKDNNNQKKTNLKEQIKENGMESVKISTKKCKIAMALAGHHSAALRQRPWVRIPLNYRNFFPVDLQLLKLQLRLRRSYLDDVSRPSDTVGVGGGLQKKVFRPFGLHFGLKIRGRPGLPGAPPVDPPLHLHFNIFLVLVYVTV